MGTLISLPAPDAQWHGVTDAQLEAAQVALALACGRSHSALRDKHRQYFCFLFSALRNESTRRGKEPPSPPFRA